MSSNTNGNGKNGEETKIPAFMTRKTAKEIIEQEVDKKLDEAKIEAKIEDKLKAYAATIFTLPTIIEQTIPIFQKTYDNILAGKKIQIEYAFIGRSSVDIYNMNRTLELIENPSTENLPKVPGDLDWILYTNIELSDDAEDRLAEELKKRAPKMPECLSKYNENYDHDFSSKSIGHIDELIEILENFKEDDEHPKKYHKGDVPHNSVVVWEAEALSDTTCEKHEKVNVLSSYDIKEKTGNPRTFDQYITGEWKSFRDKIRAYDINQDMSPFIRSLVEELPLALKYFPEVAAMQL